MVRCRAMPERVRRQRAVKSKQLDEFGKFGGNRMAFQTSRLSMTQYRYIARGRRGKWYPSLGEAQFHANRIGAGFLDPTGNFVAYRGTVLEFRD